MRRRTRKSKDRKIFKQTADKTRAVNIRPKPTRGGTRL